jgi:hypothetical protein
MNQDSARRRSDGAYRLLELLHGRAGTDDVIERVVRCSIAAQGEILFAESQLFEHPADGEPDLIDQTGTLANVIGGSSRFDRFHRSFVVIHRSDENDRRVGRNAMRMTKDFNAVHVRHLDIGDDQVIEVAVNFVFGGLAGMHSLHAVSVATQSDVQHFTNGAFVVADENVSHGTSRLQRPPKAVTGELGRG